MEKEKASMKIKNISLTMVAIVGVLSTSVLTGCATMPVGDYLSYKGQISEIGLLKTIAHVNVVDNKGQGLDPDGTLKAEENVKNAVATLLHDKYQINSKDLDTPPAQIEPALRALFGTLSTSKDVDTIKNNKVLTDYMDTYPERYFIFTYVTGFSRTGANLATSAAGSVLIGVLTLGLFVPYAIPAGSTLYFCVVDKKTQKVIYFKADNREDDPRSFDTIKDQIKEITKELVKL